MAILEILQYPNPRLKLKASPVADIDQKIRKIIGDILDTYYQQDSCAALAASQLDLKNPPAVTIIGASSTGNEDQNAPALCLINPRIIAMEGEQYEKEGCMSVCPGDVAEKVKRAYKITVQALDIEGNSLQFDAEGFLARCIQHELDHLNGVLYIDRISQLKRQLLDRKIAKLHRAK